MEATRCTECNLPVTEFEVWDYWPEDYGHEACMKKQELRMAEAIANDPDIPENSLEELYAQEGGPPYKRHQDPHRALEELAYIATEEVIQELLTLAGESGAFPWDRDDPNFGVGTMFAIVRGMRMAMDFAQSTATSKSAESHTAFLFFNLAPPEEGGPEVYGNHYREKVLWSRLGKRSQEILADRNPNNLTTER